MILPDINLLIYAHASDAPHHKPAKAWLESVMNGREPVGIAWAVACGFIRLMTDPRILEHPLTARQATGIVRSWLDQPMVSMVHPGHEHLSIMERLFTEAGVAGKLTTDVHLAALAMEQGAELHSNDRDFLRFTGLRVVNPLTRSRS